MRTATLLETQEHLNDLVEEVKGGRSVTILDHGEPVARLVPVPLKPEADVESMRRLERAQVIQPGGGGVAESILNSRPPSPMTGASALHCLLEERRSGR